MTERLYYTDAYLTTFPADVVDRAEDGTVVYLDRTAFYPTSGGQPHDTGRLGSSRVVDVVDEGDRIAHRLDGPVQPGPVEGAVDWARRFDHMQQHTGQHVLSAVLADLTGQATISVHFGREISTLDLDTPDLPPAQVVEAELRANRIVTENRPVEVSFEDAASAEGLRKASDREGTLRIVTIRDLDRSACGGTHVRASGEIGPDSDPPPGAGAQDGAAGVPLRRARGAPGSGRRRPPDRSRSRPVRGAGGAPGIVRGAAAGAIGRR